MSNDDSRLRDMAREVMETGKLPDWAPDHVWGGPGTGVRCAVCDAAIQHSETELEIEFAPRDTTAAQTFFVHLRCYSMLELERQVRSPDLAARAHESAAATSPSGHYRGNGTGS